LECLLVADEVLLLQVGDIPARAQEARVEALVGGEPPAEPRAEGATRIVHAEPDRSTLPQEVLQRHVQRDVAARVVLILPLVEAAVHAHRLAQPAPGVDAVAGHMIVGDLFGGERVELVAQELRPAQVRQEHSEAGPIVEAVATVELQLRQLDPVVLDLVPRTVGIDPRGTVDPQAIGRVQVRRRDHEVTVRLTLVPRLLVGEPERVRLVQIRDPAVEERRLNVIARPELVVRDRLEARARAHAATAGEAVHDLHAVEEPELGKLVLEEAPELPARGALAPAAESIREPVDTEAAVGLILTIVDVHVAPKELSVEAQLAAPAEEVLPREIRARAERVVPALPTLPVGGRIDQREEAPADPRIALLRLPARHRRKQRDLRIPGLGPLLPRGVLGHLANVGADGARIPDGHGPEHLTPVADAHAQDPVLELRPGTALGDGAHGRLDHRAAEREQAHDEARFQPVRAAAVEVDGAAGCGGDVDLDVLEAVLGLSGRGRQPEERAREEPTRPREPRPEPACPVDAGGGHRPPPPASCSWKSWQSTQVVPSGR